MECYLRCVHLVWCHRKLNQRGLRMWSGNFQVVVVCWSSSLSMKIVIGAGEMLQSIKHENWRLDPSIHVESGAVIWLLGRQRYTGSRDLLARQQGQISVSSGISERLHFKNEAGKQAIRMSRFYFWTPHGLVHTHGGMCTGIGTRAHTWGHVALFTCSHVCNNFNMPKVALLIALNKAVRFTLLHLRRLESLHFCQAHRRNS